MRRKLGVKEKEGRLCVKGWLHTMECRTRLSGRRDEASLVVLHDTALRSREPIKGISNLSVYHCSPEIKNLFSNSFWWLACTADLGTCGFYLLPQKETNVGHYKQGVGPSAWAECPTPEEPGLPWMAQRNHGGLKSHMPRDDVLGTKGWAEFVRKLWIWILSWLKAS